MEQAQYSQRTWTGSSGCEVASGHRWNGDEGRERHRDTVRPGNRRWRVGAQRRQSGGTRLIGALLPPAVRRGYGQGSGGGWGRLVSHQGLIGREEGGPAVIPTDGQQRHGAKLLTGKV